MGALTGKARMWAKRILPASLVRAVRAPWKHLNSLKRRKSRSQLDTLTRKQLTDDLLRGGIYPGDVIMVHASLSRIGNVDGGAATVIASLLDGLEPDGTLIMPCYNSAEEVVKKSKKNILVDLRTSPSEVGKITEVFRTTTGVRRSSHPFSSACALGAKADYITSAHAEAPEVCHASSPVGRLVKSRGTIVGIGIPIAQGLGVAHYIEDTYSGFPFEVHANPFEVSYTDADGNLVQREVSRYDPDIARTRIDYPEGKWIGEQLTKHLNRVGILKHFRFGHAASWTMEAALLYEELKRLADKGITMYLTPDKLDDRNRDIENW